MFLCTEAEAASETSLPSYPTTHCNIPDDCPLDQHGNVNPKSRFCKPDELNFGVFFFPKERKCLSQWPRLLSRRSAAARLLRSWVRIPPGAWTSFCCECCAFSGRGLCDELITRPEESYRMRCVVVCDLATWGMRRACPNGGCCAKRKKEKNFCGSSFLCYCVLLLCPLI